MIKSLNHTFDHLTYRGSIDRIFRSSEKKTFDLVIKLKTLDLVKNSSFDQVKFELLTISRPFDNQFLDILIAKSMQVRSSCFGYHSLLLFTTFRLSLEKDWPSGRSRMLSKKREKRFRRDRLHRLPHRRILLIYVGAYGTLQVC